MSLADSPKFLRKVTPGTRFHETKMARVLSLRLPFCLRFVTERLRFVTELTPSTRSPVTHGRRLHSGNGSGMGTDGQAII